MAMNSSLRYCNQIKLIGNGVLAANVRGIPVVSIQTRAKSDKGSCCKEISQAVGKRVESWPRADASGWRTECPCDPQPANYDPYRIKVANVVVPPLPSSNAKPMLDCTKAKGPCTGRAVPPDPPCPPPPKKPFPWIYVWPWVVFMSAIGIIYRVYLWREESEKLGDSKPIWQPRRKTKRPYHCDDLPPCVQYLIIGTGAAAWAAYEAIQETDKNAKVFFISKEDITPYRRPPLSKHMWWNPEPPNLAHLNYLRDGARYSMYNAKCDYFMDPVNFYRKKKGPAVSLASGWCVLRIDADDHVAWVKTMCGEQPIYYERCLYAPGSKPKNLNVFKTAPKPVRDRVCTMRTIRDLEIAYRKVQAAKHVTVIGAGPLGCELAWHLGQRNKVVEREEDTPPLDIVHIFKDKGILPGIVPEYLGEWAVEKIKCENVEVIPKTQVYDAFMTPEGKLQLTLSNGKSVETDYVFVAVGASPREEIADISFLELDEANGGFLVNTELAARTHLYVAGDAASYFSQWKNHRLRTEHYDNALQQGRLAGLNMTGQWNACNVEPHFWFTLGHTLEVEVVGEVGACMPTVGVFKPCEGDRLAHKDPNYAGKDMPCFKQSEEYQSKYKKGILFYLRDDTVVGVVLWNIPPIEDRRDVVTEMLRARPSYKDINMLAELLGFPETECTKLADEEVKEPGPCIRNFKIW